MELEHRHWILWILTSTLIPSKGCSNCWNASTGIFYCRPGSSEMEGGSFGSFDKNHCKAESRYVWCLPAHYNLEKHPFSCKSPLNNRRTITLILCSVFENVNKSLPWDYDFRFVIEEINNINDKAQVGNISIEIESTNLISSSRLFLFQCTLLCRGWNLVSKLINLRRNGRKQEQDQQM